VLARRRRRAMPPFWDTRRVRILRQPAVSRMFAYVTSALPATSENSGVSWVQPTISGPPRPAARNFRGSARQSWRAVETSAPRQPRRTAEPSSGIGLRTSRIRCLAAGRPFRLRLCEAAPMYFALVISAGGCPVSAVSGDRASRCRLLEARRLGVTPGGSGPRCVARYKYYKQPSRVRAPKNAPARAHALAPSVEARARICRRRFGW